MSITKSEIADRVAEVTGSTKKLAAEIVGATFDQITSALASGSDVRIPGFGQFVVKGTKARKARNPRTGEQVDVPAGLKVSFKPAAELKKAV
ncbi:HU family DNA-binding protein [Shinella zoogloeoides]|uniref:HU family DNA-binding protein n=1 Tax=Shinella zoogloeoides TaxID=352475 RepID=UPI00299E32EC|nr:HU family DNA-binding protein [Shinella zoogloeoides]WPE19880.1 DNA-binding protein HU [Shinella zoogloeoides]